MRTVSEEKIESKHRAFTWIVFLIFGGLGILFVTTLIGRNRPAVELKAELAAARKLGIPLTYEEYFARDSGAEASSGPPEYVRILKPVLDDLELSSKLNDARFAIRTELNSYGNPYADKKALLKTLRNAIEPFPKLIEAIHRAAALERWPHYQLSQNDVSAAQSWQMELSNALYLLLAAAIVDAEAGRWDLALEHLQGAYRLSVRFSDERTFIGMVRLKEDYPRQLEVQRALASLTNCPASFLKKLAQLNEQELTSLSPARLFELAHVELYTDLFHPRNRELYFDEEVNPYERMIDSFGKPAISIEEAQAIWLKSLQSIYQSVDLRNAEYTEVIAAIRRNAPPVDAAIDGLLPSSGGWGAFSTLADLLSDAEKIEKKVLAERRLMKVFLLCMEHYRRAGVFPKALPLKGQEAIDPFTGNPLRYQLRKGGFLAYSLGENGADDGGREFSSANRNVDDFSVEYPVPPPNLGR